MVIGSTLLYTGLIVTATGLASLARPPRVCVTTRRKAAGLAIVGAAITVVAATWPAPARRVRRVSSRLDELMPVWQFGEFHRTIVNAPPVTVYRAMEEVRAGEIVLLRTLTAIRRGFREMPPGILNPGTREPILQVATRTGFVRLIDEPPRELVIGMVVIAPGSSRAGTPSPPLESFTEPLPPGYAVAMMNFAVSELGPAESLLTTETRIFASSAGVSRRFAAYWRLIYPGSAWIRRMWLRAIRLRAEQPGDRSAST